MAKKHFLITRFIILMAVLVLFPLIFLPAQSSNPGVAFRQEGIASWYGIEFNGRPTGSGEIFDAALFTAAHPTLPFGTVLTVTNKINNKKVSVRVNDRGPFVSTRIIDISRAAAEQLDMLVTGTAPVVIEAGPVGLQQPSVQQYQPSQPVQQQPVIINNTSGLVMVPTTGKKKALVIGNSNYQHLTRLSNPSNDAKDITTVLQAANYTVFSVFDGDLKTMEAQISNFNKSITSGDTVLVFYAGHGVQNGGENYLLPIDQDIRTNAELRRKAFSLQEISDNLEHSPAAKSIIILDACRNSPLPDRGAERGLSVITKQPHESVVIFSTAPNTTAQDGAGRNSPFTQVLKEIMLENAPIIQLMPKLIQKVRSITGNEQTPWVNSNASNLFSFSGDTFMMQ
ncbi:hypothetical protein AGMMS49940_16540 [Spirochaetia bacterium]|nr:hypothetical protein AGMMS49940_16540 [Spirochaetia bacterium]